jgi:superfamily II DNA or RNA helicase
MSQISLFEKPAITIPHAPKVAAVPFVPKAAGKKQGLFPFQSKMVHETYDLIRVNEKRILWIAAPSAGKTRISGQVMIDATQRAKKPLRTAFVVEMDVLAQQTLDTYNGLGLNATIFKAGRKYDPDADVVVISSQTLEQRAKTQGVAELLGQFGLILGDEIHTLSQRQGWKLLNDAYSASSTVFIGMTGSPWNTGDRSLYHWFDKMVCAPQPPELVKMGRLVIVRGFSPDDMFESKDLKWKDGDYDLGAQQDTAIEDKKLQLVLEKYKERGEGRAAIAYCSGIKHAKMLTRVFNADGIAAEFQIGSTPSAERKAQHARLESGETKVLFSIGTCTKGYDAPFVSCIILARAVGNVNLYHQMACRGNRAHTYPDGTIKNDCLLIDLGGNCDRFGHLPTDYQDYSAALMPPKQKQEPEEFYKICPECKHEKISMFAQICPACGYEFGKDKDDDQPELFDIASFQLKEFFTPLGSQQIQFVRSRKRQYFVEKINPDNVAKEFAKEFGFIPPTEWHLWAVSGRRAGKADRKKYFEYLKLFAPHDQWIHIHMKFEFGDAKEIPKFLANWKEQWWEVLGVDRTASREQVKAAYINAMKKWHPDVCDDQTNAKIQAQILNNAWEKYNASNAV